MFVSTPVKCFDTCNCLLRRQVKNNQLSMNEAELIFREWQMRYSDGKSPSFKQKQV